MKKQIGARVLDILRANPPDWLIEAVAPLLQLAIPQHLKFLRTYLLVAQQNVFTVAMRVAAGNFVAHHLPEISEQQEDRGLGGKNHSGNPGDAGCRNPPAPREDYRRKAYCCHTEMAECLPEGSSRGLKTS